MDKLKVVIATPVRIWRGPEHMDEDLPHIGRGLREFALRGSKEWPVAHTKEDLDFHAEAQKYELEFMAAVGGLSRARNNLTEEALKAGADFILWNDDDLDPDGMTLAEAWLRLLSHRQPIVGGLYCKRDRNARRPKWACSFMPAAELQPEGLGLLQVAELAIGLKCYHRKVFTEIKRIFGTDALEAKRHSICYRDRDTGEQMTGWFQNRVDDGDLLSEDYFLDQLARVAKIGILADTKIKCRHRSRDGKEVYPEKDFPPIPAKVAKT